MKKTVTIIAMWLVLMQTTLYAQYDDHRNRQVDSLENVLATNPPTGADLARLYNNLAWDYQQINIEKSMDYARKCIETAVPLNDFRSVAISYRVMGVNFYKKSHYDSAMVYYDKALDAAERMRDFPKKFTEERIDSQFSLLYGTIANLYNIQGKSIEAIEYYQKALPLFEKYDWQESQAIVYQNIGEMYMSMNNYAQADINFNKLDSLAHIMGDAFFIAVAKKHLGHLYLSTQDYETALQNVETAYAYFFSHPEEEGENRAVILNYLSAIYLYGYGYERQAEEYVRQSLDLLDDLDIPREKAISLRILSAIHLKRGEWRKSEQTALAALAVDDSAPSNTLALYGILAKSYAKLGDSDKAWAYFDQHDALQSSWSTRHYQSAIREMEVKYDTEKKERELQQQQHVIVRQNLQRRMLAAAVAFCVVILSLTLYLLRLRNRRNRALAEMNATKDKFFSIISHDMKNPAVTQRDALRMLVGHASSWDAPALSAYYHKLLKSAEGQVALIYNLLDWARIQTGRTSGVSHATFNLATRLRDDISLIRQMAAAKGIAFSVSMPVDAPVTGDANMLATVVRNLLANAVKFTAEGGEVTLEITPCGKDGARPVSTSYIVSVSDTGVGMTAEQINHLFRLDNPHLREGTSGEQGSGLGLIVCREMLAKHGTTLKIESEAGKGSKVWFGLRIEN